MSFTCYCRACAKFVSNPLAKCTSCGHEHTRHAQALGEPIPWRRKGRRPSRQRYRR